MGSNRFTLPADRYLAKHHVLTYLEDAIAQLLDRKDDSRNVDPIRFLSDYFTSLKQGSHTLYREYSYIESTPHNRASFIRTFWRSFSYIGKKGDLLNLREYHSLICLLCNDFPFDIVQKTGRIILMDDAMDCLISFPDFLYAFQAQFYYNEFLNKCTDVYSSLYKSPQSPREPVVIPSTDGQGTENRTPPEKNNTASGNFQAGDGIDSMQLFRAIVPLCEKVDYSTPPPVMLRKILTTAPRVTFYGFLFTFAKDDDINAHIGKLPSKSKILDITDQEMNIPSSIFHIRPSSAKEPLPPSTAATPASTQISMASNSHSLPPTSHGTRNLQTRAGTRTGFRPKTRLTKKSTIHSDSSVASSSDDSTADSSDD